MRRAAGVVDAVLIRAHDAQPLLARDLLVRVIVSLDVGGGLAADVAHDPYLIAADLGALRGVLLLHLLALEILLRDEAGIHQGLFQLIWHDGVISTCKPFGWSTQKKSPTVFRSGIMWSKLT